MKKNKIRINNVIVDEFTKINVEPCYRAIKLIYFGDEKKWLLSYTDKKKPYYRCKKKILNG